MSPFRSKSRHSGPVNGNERKDINPLGKMAGRSPGVPIGNVNKKTQGRPVGAPPPEVPVEFSGHPASFDISDPSRFSSKAKLKAGGGSPENGEALREKVESQRRERFARSQRRPISRHFASGRAVELSEQTFFAFSYFAQGVLHAHLTSVSSTHYTPLPLEATCLSAP